MMMSQRQQRTCLSSGRIRPITPKTDDDDESGDDDDESDNDDE